MDGYLPDFGMPSVTSTLHSLRQYEAMAAVEDLTNFEGMVYTDWQNLAQ